MPSDTSTHPQLPSEQIKISTLLLLHIRIFFHLLLSLIIDFGTQKVLFFISKNKRINIVTWLAILFAHIFAEGNPILEMVNTFHTILNFLYFSTIVRHSHNILSMKFFLMFPRYGSLPFDPSVDIILTDTYNTFALRSLIKLLVKIFYFIF